MRTTIIIFLVFFFSGCKREVFTNCGTLRCPPIQNVIYLFTVDANGKPKKASYIETYNPRTGKIQTNLQGPPNYIGGETYKYRLFTNPRDFSTVGDHVSVLVTSESGKEYKLDYTVKGGTCTCDVQKLDGLDKLVID